MESNEQIFREIKSGLALKGITLVDIGREVRSSRQQVWFVAKGLARTQYIREAIARALGRDPWTDSGN